VIGQTRNWREGWFDMRCKLFGQSGVVISQRKVQLCCSAALAVFLSQFFVLAFSLCLRCPQQLPARCLLSNEVRSKTRNPAECQRSIHTRPCPYSVLLYCIIPFLFSRWAQGDSNV
jgi:hypothetical protein